jgi:hypothetical protein
VRDGLDVFGHLRHLPLDALDPFSHLQDTLLPLVHAAQQGIDDAFSPGSLLARMHGQLADLGSNHRKALALLTRLGSLHGGIQREDVGLEADLLDGPGDQAGLPGSLGHLGHEPCHMVHHPLAFPGALGDRFRQVEGVFSIPGTLRDRRGKLFHAGRDLLDAGRLPAAALGKIVLIDHQLPARSIDGRRCFIDGMNGGLQGGHGFVVGLLNLQGCPGNRCRICGKARLGQALQQAPTIIHQGQRLIQQGVDRLHQLLGRNTLLGFEPQVQITKAHVLYQFFHLILHSELFCDVPPLHGGTHPFAMHEDGVTDEAEGTCSEMDLGAIDIMHLPDNLPRACRIAMIYIV